MQLSVTTRSHYLEHVPRTTKTRPRFGQGGMWEGTTPILLVMQIC